MRASYQRRWAGGDTPMTSEDGAGNGLQEAGNGAARALSFSGSPSPAAKDVEMISSETQVTETVIEAPYPPQAETREEPPPTQPDPPAEQPAASVVAKARPLAPARSAGGEDKKVSIYEDGMYWKLLGGQRPQLSLSKNLGWPGTSRATRTHPRRRTACSKIRRSVTRTTVRET